MKMSRDNRKEIGLFFGKYGLMRIKMKMRMRIRMKMNRENRKEIGD